jgi:NAD(P)-dependent dehydrogenase (short-subunit alcohol dehydrogenase family)
LTLELTDWTRDATRKVEQHLRINAMTNSKDVVVTGVSTGIGWGTTKVLVSKGFRVFGSVRKQADANRLQGELGNGFVPLLMDITDADAVHQAARKVGSMIGDTARLPAARRDRLPLARTSHYPILVFRLHA